MKAIIHVNQHKIRKHDPKPIIVRTYKFVEYASDVQVNGPSRFVYRPEKPLSCGARLWVEVDNYENIEIKG